MQIAREFGALVIGEGVDDPLDLMTLRELNVPLIQGFLLGMPEAQPRFEPVTADAVMTS